MTGSIFWLCDGGPREEVGARVQLLSQLSKLGFPIPPGFVLGRELFERYAEHARAHSPRIGMTSLPESIRSAVLSAFSTLGGPVAVRRSPLEKTPAKPRRGGRPDRETFLNLHAATDVIEAARRAWVEVLTQPDPQPMAVLVQRFAVSDRCATVRIDPHDDGLLLVEASYGIGDLLASGLVVPDRHWVRKFDGSAVKRKLGRKRQMTMPRGGGGVRRVPTPLRLSNEAALDDPSLARLAAMWRRTENAIGRLALLTASLNDAGLFVTRLRQAE